METIQITKENKYSTKDIAKWIRQTLKQKYNNIKFSVTMESYSGGSNIDVTLLENNRVRIMKRPEEVNDQDVLHLMAARNDSEEETKERIRQQLNCNNFQVNIYHLESDWQFTDKGKQLLKEILEIAQKHNWDKSDVQSDYFNVNYYLHLNLGRYDKPYKEVRK